MEPAPPVSRFLYRMAVLANKKRKSSQDISLAAKSSRSFAFCKKTQLRPFLKAIKTALTFSIGITRLGIAR
jgi:hypothetical protein